MPVVIMVGRAVEVVIAAVMGLDCRVFPCITGIGAANGDALSGIAHGPYRRRINHCNAPFDSATAGDRSRFEGGLLKSDDRV